MFLDEEKTFETYDTLGIGASLGRMHEQIDRAWQETRTINVPAAYRGIQNVVIVGMGGSHLSPHMLTTALSDRVRVPILRIRDYTLPSFVDSRTLVVLSSFSGTTEEVLFAGREAKKRGLKLAAIASGGALQAFVNRHKIPAYIFMPGDLAIEPRLGTGFTFMGLVGLLERAGLLKISGADVRRMCHSMQDVAHACAMSEPTKNNPAKTVAIELKDRAVFCVASEHLVGVAHMLSNQINENGKQLADYYEIPELNHHLMEGLTYPKGLVRRFTVLMMDSELYHPHNQRRYELTAQVFEKQGAKVIEYQSGGGSRLEELGEVMQFGSFVSYYTSMLNRVNPKDIPFVDWFKAELKK